MRLSFIIFLLTTLGIYSLSAQTPETIDYGESGEYEIAAVEIEGTKHADIPTLRAISGLKVGKVIKVPGAAIQNAIKNLNRLRLFSDIEIIEDKREEDLIYLRIILTEKPTLSKYGYKGAKKSRHEDLNAVVSKYLVKGSMVTDYMKDNGIKAIKNYYKDKGYYDAEVTVSEKPDKIRKNSIVLEFQIDRKDKVKIKNISFTGNETVKDKKLKKVMEETKEKRRIFASSKYDPQLLESDKDLIVAYYNTLGFRDMKFTGDSLWRDEKGFFNLRLSLDEGRRYYFGDINWRGNSLYTDEQLDAVLGIEKGDVFDEELLQTRLSFSLDGRDVSSLYLDDGYLFFTADPVEVAVRQDSIDMEMRIFEGPQATIDKVIINGNDRTHDHVIRRELRTLPGEKFSRSDIIRSQREIINLGYFNPESINIGTPVNQQEGTVDIVYTVEETPSDQLELSAGFGGFSGVVGTLGVTFNNFSLRNALQGGAWNPVPQGDGQRLSLRAQTNGRFFRSYNFSFTEPWLGGRKRNSFSLGAVYTAIDQSALSASGTQNSLTISRFFAGLGTQLKWPDDFFTSQTTLTFEFIDLQNYTLAGRNFTFVDENGLAAVISTGNFRNFTINQVFSRSSISEPLFPRSGSRVSVNLKFTPPYSLFKEDRFWELTSSEQAIEIDKENQDRFIRGLPAMSKSEENSYIFGLETAERFSLLEYHKWRIDAEWYFSLVGKLVVRSAAKIGLLGTYDRSIGFSPFERFQLGGDGLSNQNAGLTGVDILAMRGYEENELDVNNQGGGTVFNKYTLELRYPISLNPSSTIYALTFVEGGNAWLDPGDFNPFSLRRSAGVGLRVFLPMFGLLGFDYGYGFDKPGLINSNARPQEYGQFNIILGFEPD